MINSFDDVSSEYKKISISQHSAAMKLIDLIKQSYGMTYRKSILDIGCASAVNTEALIKNFAPMSIEGIDISNNMIFLAKEFISKDNSVNISFRCKDLMCFDSEKRFNLIFCNSVLYHIDSYLSFFERYKKMLTTDGIFAVQYQSKVTQEFLNCFVYLSYFPKLIPYFEDYKFPVFFPKITYIESVLSEVGLNLSYAEEVNHQHHVYVDKAVEIFKSGPFIPYTNQKAYNYKLYAEFGDDLLRLIRFGLEKQAIQKKVVLNTPRVYLLIDRDS